MENFQQRCDQVRSRWKLLGSPSGGRVPPKTESDKVPGLFNIYKRTTDLAVNKCIGMGFTYEQAQEFINRRLKVVCDYEKITFYDIVEQGNEAAKNPLWNDKSTRNKKMSDYCKLDTSSDCLWKDGSQAVEFDCLEDEDE